MIRSVPEDHARTPGARAVAYVWRLQFLQLAGLALALALFAGCGGGGGGSGNASRGSPASDPGNQGPPTRPWPHDAIKTGDAYAHVARALGPSVRPGAGVTIGFIDSGIDLSHPDFRDRTHRSVEEIDLLETGEAGFAADRMRAPERIVNHGTAVASIAAGWRDAVDSRGQPDSDHGVAWAADIRMLAIRLETADPSTPPIADDDLSHALDDIAQIFEAALPYNDDIVNASFGIAGDRSIASVSESQLRQHGGRLITALSQAGSTDKAIIVWAAGNAGQERDGRGSSVTLLPGLPSRIPELRSHVIAVVATRQDGLISGFSNRCGIAADWCIAAPGQDLLVAEVDGGYASGSGTSFAAPVVSGGLAVMKQLFRSQLSSEELVTRLYATADKTGPYSDEDTYGQGLMDLGAATAPVGPMSISSGSAVDSPGFSFARTGLAAGPALGDGPAVSLAGREIAALDSLGAPFWHDMGSLVGSAARPSLHARYRNLMAPRREPRSAGIVSLGSAPLAFGTAPRSDADQAGRLHLGLVDAAAFGKGGHAALVNGAATASFISDKVTVSAFTTEGLDWRKPVSGTTLSWRPAGGPVALRTGWLDEREGLLGSSTDGAFGRLAARGGYAGIEAGFETRNWVVGGFAEIGISSANPQGGIATEISRLTTSAFSLDATRQVADNTVFSLSVSQPLRAEDGHARLSVPVGRTPDGQVLRQSVTADLSPTGREIDVAARLRHRLDAAGEVRLGAAWAHDPGHVAGADPELAVLAGWRLEF